jgi:ATP-dependent Clp protease protease subunit
MSKEGTINIIGYIGSDIFSDNSLASVMNQVANLGDVDSYLVNINSGGGEVTEGYAIHNYLVSLGKPITTRGIGLVGSIATVIFLAGSKRELYTSTQFLIHNPWTYGEGDSAALLKRAEELKGIEDALIDFYNTKTGSDKTTLSELMKQDKMISSDVAHELKFCTSIIETVKAFAKYKKQDKMSKKKSIWDSIKAELKRLNSVMNSTVKTTDGDTLEVEMAGDSVAIGDMVMIDGEAVSGTYTFEDGTVIVVADGVVTEVTIPSAETETVEQLQARITELTTSLTNATTELETLRAESTEMSANMEAIVNHLKKLKHEVKLPAASTKFNTKTVLNAEETEEEVKLRMAELRKKKTQLRVGV